MKEGLAMQISTQIKPETAKTRRTKWRQLIGAIDQGTSSTRFLVFENGTGHLVASSQIEIKRIVPKEGWVEMDPNAIMESVYTTIAKVQEQLAKTNGSSSLRDSTNKLKCIGICNQRESTVVWDSKTGKALYNVILWMDNRTKDLVDDMIDSVPGRDFNWLKDKTGLPMSTYFSAFKLKWLIDNVIEVKLALKENRLLFGTVDSWILWNLTGRHLTDVTNASRTFLMDIETLNWDKTLCKHFSIPMKILPKILSSADDFGQVQHGPLKGLPITGVIGDQSAALFGHKCLQLGQTKATFGTGCFIMQNIGPGPLNGALSGVQREAKRGLVTTVAYKLRDRPACYALEGSIKIAGAALTWLRDNMQLIQNYDECDQLVNKTTHSAGVFFVPALGGLYSPYWDPNAAGIYIGLSQFSRREHLVRATYDSIAFQTNDILSLMRGVTNGLMIDGGLCKSDNMCQILADITGCDIVRPSMCETSALGAAMVAGCGANIWSYESMLANSNTPYEYSSSSNQNRHYPHESLHYDDKFLSLIQSKNFPITLGLNHQQQQGLPGQGSPLFGGVSNRGLACVLDAGGGGGICDDAGGGQMSSEEYDETGSSSGAGGQSSALDSEDAEDSEVGAARASSVFTCPIRDNNNSGSDNSDNNNEVHQKCVVQTVSVQLQSIIDSSSIDQEMPYYATPSSDYYSSDNYELTTTNSAGSSEGLIRRDSPISSSQVTELLTTSDEQMMLMATDCCDESSTLLASNDLMSARDVTIEDDDNGVSKERKTQSASERSSFTMKPNVSSCFRNYICTSTTGECLHQTFEDDDLYEDDYDSTVDCNQEPLTSVENHPSNCAESSIFVSTRMITKPVDVFQSYISLEHRTELVNTWIRAVERSMQWTKIHHEEIRRIDYQRLSSLPISMYLFFSIGILALSGLVSATGHGVITR